MNDKEKFEEDFGMIKKKISYRMHEAWQHQEFSYRFLGARYSDEQEEGLRVGTLITHCDDEGRGGSGIFDNSKVLMYEFKRGESIMGVIINKKVNGSVRIGGPCGLRRPIESTDKILIHNIPNVQGSKRVIEGVYWHDGPKTDLTPLLS